MPHHNNTTIFYLAVISLFFLQIVYFICYIIRISRGILSVLSNVKLTINFNFVSVNKKKVLFLHFVEYYFE